MAEQSRESLNRRADRRRAWSEKLLRHPVRSALMLSVQLAVLDWVINVHSLQGRRIAASIGISLVSGFALIWLMRRQYLRQNAAPSTSAPVAESVPAITQNTDQTKPAAPGLVKKFPARIQWAFACYAAVRIAAWITKGHLSVVLGQVSVGFLLVVMLVIASAYVSLRRSQSKANQPPGIADGHTDAS